MIFKKIISLLGKNFKIINYKKNNFKKIIIKFGIDPTGNKIHLGHFYILKKLKVLQKIKNIYVAVVIGGYTATIGDPSKIKKKRKLKNNIKKNSESIKKEISRILLKKKTFFYNNNNWLRQISIEKILELNLKKLISRKEIKKRIKKKNNNIKLGEIIYPFFQNYDNFFINNNIEIGGKDQLFNFTFLKKKCFIYSKLLPGIKSKKKMSSSKNNCLYLKDNYKKIFIKVIKMPDYLVKVYYNFFNFNKKYNYLFKNITKDKNFLTKIKLAFCVVKFMLGKKESKRIPNYYYRFIKKKPIDVFVSIKLPTNIVNFLYNFIKKSKNYIKSIIRQGGVTLDSIKINELNYLISEYKSYKFKIGKKKYNLYVKRI
ncbi:tyrosine--tRNA ligase [Candidatus Vidania fulgoroideorum]